jgi:predicted enzyme related to lactoylglutathione lyase/uncharacterized protein YndB with AHSA1/START domain
MAGAPAPQDERTVVKTNPDSANTLSVKRFLKAPREKVYAAWTKADEIAKWFGPETCQVLSAQLEPRVGATFHLRLRDERMGDIEVRGVYREATPSRLVFTWNCSGHPALNFAETLVTVDFLARDGGTDLHITHEGLPDAQWRDDHQAGWSGCLDKLARFLGLACERTLPQGSFCWNELMTTDLEGASRFYSRLLGWQTADFPAGGMKYTLFKKGDRGVGGMLTVPAPGIPPHWLAYVLVGDVDATAREAANLGGTVLKPPFDVPTVGRIAIVQDPQGAAVGLFKPLPEEE